ncbi:TolC family protein [Sphingobacterium gobiense]|uniref:TolC family protein n=1 Tax=Sphingobacterium gobiense TaxID=1382456 RepID=A0A2S9JU17_9SPHI|nr:TolC family protein [Sphingobacterium gobiense]PRD56759.1 hypothetical protein C5749_05895 [Sphingobacterium gobiense]
MGKYLFILLIIVGWYGAARAQADKTRQLTLQESIDIASDSSLQSFRVKNLYLANYWQYRSFKAGRLPSLNLNLVPVQYNREFTKRYDPDNNIDVYRVQQSFYTSGNISINQNLDWTGGTFFIDSQLGYFRNFSEGGFSQYSSVPLRIGYVQNLMGFNPFKWEKKVEPLKYEKAKKQYLYEREEIAEAVIELFFGLATAQAEFEMASDNVNSSDTLFLMGQERLKIAAISQADMLTLKLDAVNARNTLKNSEIELQRATFSLSNYLNMDKSEELAVVLPERPMHINIPIEQALLLAAKNNPDYLANRQEIMEAEREVERTRREAAFQASLSASAGFNQVDPTFAGAYRNPLQQNLVSIGLTIPILDWGVRKGKVNMARNNLNIAKISTQQREQSLEQDVMVTVSEFGVQQDMINSAEEALELGLAAFQATKQRFIIGKSDINSLTLSLNRQKDAQKNYIAALKNYWTCYFRIRKLTLYDFNSGESLSYIFDNMHM